VDTVNDEEAGPGFGGVGEIVKRTVEAGAEKDAQVVQNVAAMLLKKGSVEFTNKEVREASVAVGVRGIYGSDLVSAGLAGVLRPYEKSNPSVPALYRLNVHSPVEGSTPENEPEPEELDAEEQLLYGVPLTPLEEKVRQRADMKPYTDPRIRQRLLDMREEKMQCMRGIGVFQDRLKRLALEEQILAPFAEEECAKDA
jgi:hypothetical protein